MMLADYLSAHIAGRVAAADLEPAPWPHAYLADALPPDLARGLSRSFSGIGMEECEETRQAKSYRFRTARLAGDGAGDMPGGEWGTLAGALSGAGYRDSVSALTGVPLDQATLTLDLWEYRAGDWLAPHVDKPEKLVTQIFYLTEGWAAPQRGRLLILGGQHPGSVARALPPALGSSAILVRSSSSWHAVEPPAQDAPSRRSLTATFWRPGQPVG